MINYVFLDLDGVLADFVKAICAAHGRPSPYPQHRGQTEISQIWGMPEPDFWAPTRGEAFWLNMDKLPKAEWIVEAAVRRAGSVNRVYIATSPSADRQCLSGKKGWVEKWFPALKSRVITVKDKWLLAAPNRMLIDDTEKKIADWRKPPDGNPGGFGVWCPSEANLAPESNLLSI